MIKLYDFLHSHNGYKVRLLFSFLGINYQRIEVDLTNKSGIDESIRQLNPRQSIPFVIDDGHLIRESAMILLHYSKNTYLFPKDADCQKIIMEWLFFEQNQIEKYIAIPRFYKFVLKKKTIVAEQFFQPWLVVRAAKQLDQALNITPCLAGDKITIADIALFATISSTADAGYRLDRFEHINSWCKKFRQEDGFVEKL